MEEWQISHIQKHLVNLIQNTTCHELLFARLEAKGILSKAEIEVLKTVGKSEGNLAQCGKLYEYLVKKTNGYNALATSLMEDRQTGALEILLCGYNQNELEIPVLLQNYERGNHLSQVDNESFTVAPVGVEEYIETQIQAGFLIISTLDRYLTCKKIKENVKGVKVFDTLQELISNREKTQASVFITENISDSFNKLVFLFGTKRKLIIITEQRLETINESYLQNGICLEDHIKWNDLSTTLQQRVWLRLEQHSQVKLQPTDVEKLQGKLLVDLIKDEDFDMFKNTIPKQLDYYVERRLMSRSIISHEIFEDRGNDIFLFTGLERFKLASLVDTQTDMSQSQLNKKKLTVRFILLQTKSDFDGICNITEHPVHWLHYNDKEQLVWMKTRGNIEAVQNCIDMSQMMTSEDQFLELLEWRDNLVNSVGSVCISDSPGMGKSVLLGHLGKKLQAKYPDRLVIFVVVSELNEFLEKAQEQDLSHNLLNSISKLISDQELVRGIFTEKIKSEGGQLELLIDGFDEIEPKEQKIFLEQLNRISFQSIRFWITTRPHLLQKLEKSLQVLGQNIQPFDSQDQLEFLVSYWTQSQKGCNKKLATGKLEIFSQNVLEKVQSRMNDKERSIAGIPLQCMLIAEVFKDEAVKYSDIDNDLSIQNVSPEICINSISDLYKLMVQTKVSNYKTKYPLNPIDQEHVYKRHVFLSLTLLFPEVDKIFGEELQSEITHDQVMRIGILESASSEHLQPRFIHRTFAEYFVALFVYKSLKIGMSGNLVEFLTEKILLCKKDNVWTSFSFINDVVCFFLDNFLDQEQHPELFSSRHVEKLFNSPKMYQVCLACASGDFVNIFNLLNALHAFDAHACKIFDDNFVFLATSNCGIELLSIVCQQYQKIQCKPISEISQDGYTVLHAALSRGDASIVEYLLKNQGFGDLVKKSQLNCLIQECVQYTSKYSASALQQVKDILRLLLEMNKSLLEERDELGCTPILSLDMHVTIIGELIKLGANVEAVDMTDSSTLLHKVLENGVTSENYNSILHLIPYSNLKKLVKIKDEGQRTPLHALVQHFDPLLETLECYKSTGADFNSKDCNGNTILVCAIKSGRSVDCVDQLIKHGAKLNTKQPVFLHAAAEGGHIWLLEFLLRAGLDVNGKNSKGQTPLHLAVNEGRVNVVMYLLEQSANINAKDIFENTPLHYTMSNRCNGNSLEITRFLVESQADINVSNDEDQTPLQYALEEMYHRLSIPLLEYFDSKDWLSTPQLQTLALRSAMVLTVQDLEEESVIRFSDKLVDREADLSHVDENGNTLLHVAACRRSIHGIKYLIEKGLDVNVKNMGNETPLHCLIKESGTKVPETVSILVQLGADLNSVDNDNNTPLHLAIKHNILIVIECLLQSPEGNLCENILRDVDVVYLSAEYSHFEVFKFVCDQYTTLSGKRILDSGGNGRFKSVLHAVLSRETCIAMYDFVEYLLGEQGYEQRLGEDLFQDLILVGVTNTTENYILSDLMDAIELFVEKNPRLLTVRNYKGKFAWEIKSLNKDVRKFLKGLRDNGVEETKDDTGSNDPSQGPNRLAFWKRSFSMRKKK